MVDLVVSAGRLLLALFLVVLNGFFVASEFALVRVRATAVERMAEAGRPGSGALQAVVDNLDDYLATTQLGITIASLGLGWVGEPAVAAIIEPALAPVVPEGTIHLVAFALGFSVITFLHVVFGELAPKTIAIQRAEGLALLIAPPMRLFYFLFIPGIVVFNGTANAFTRLLGIEPASETEETLGEEEILMVLGRAGRQGQIDHREVEMIERVFDLDDTTVREVMIPRPDVASVAPDTPLDELRSTLVEAAYTRIPVIGGDDAGDQVHGFVDAKDVLAAIESDRAESTTAADLAREMPLFPETIPLDTLLADMQREHTQMAAVIDEFGVFEGIVTVEDLVEKVVGEIRDEFDASESEPSVENTGDGVFAIDGRVAIRDVNQRLGTDLEADVAGTIGGLVLARLERAPEAGDRVEVDGYSLTVSAVDGARISQITARETEGEDAESAAE